VDTLVDGVETALEAAKKSDVIVVSLGGASTRDFETKFDANGAAISGSKNMTSGENIDLADISIPLAQVDLIKAIATLNKPMVGLIIQGRVHAIDEIKDYFDTLFIAGFPGEHAGRAFGRILSGEVSPSGKMAMSVPGSKLHIPSFYNYKKSEQNENYVDHKLVSKYPFGYGLSYSNFKISDITYAYDEDVIIKGVIKNEGPFDASEVIQVYIRHESSSVIQRIKALKTFKKMHLKNNETKAFELVISQDDLKVWTKDMTFEIEEGKTLIMVEATNFKFEFTIDKVGKPTW
ncbi:MAG TPA: glycoside hydrolase family 3 C-terminal domain-containing protein, partial [Erysipelothrix sp.]|nr:glycoside hydrolase family 3 C-terminal domain-containing protein [Erysipelothrix sp.]